MPLFSLFVTPFHSALLWREALLKDVFKRLPDFAAQPGKWQSAENLNLGFD
jgi:hypothetical protein